MNKSFAVLTAGIVTSIATVVVVALIHAAIGFNVFSFGFFVIIPVGAIVCGFAAASGYYFAARYLHIMPKPALLVQMIVVAAVSQIAIYYLEYRTLIVEGTQVSSIIGFADYLDISLTKTHMRLGRGAHIDTGEVGSFGYWLAVIDFVGFLAGGAALYLTLKATPACERCSKYLHSVHVKKDQFDDPQTFAEYYDTEFSLPVDSEEFARHVSQEHSGQDVGQDSIRLETNLLKCPDCNAQLVSQKVQAYSGKEWKEVGELGRRTRVPDGVDLSSAYRGYASV